MGCISSKILTRSGSLHEKANQGFQGSGFIEEIILSNSKSSGDQFLALLRTSSAAARRSKADAADQSTAPAAASKIETINVSELLAGLEEEEENTAEGEVEEQERHDDRKEGEKISPRCLSDGAAGRARSFRTLEEFDAMVTRCSSPEQGPTTALAFEQDTSVPPPQQSSSPEQAGTAPALAPEPVTSLLLPPPPPAESRSSEHDAVATASSVTTPGQGEARGAKRRARARQLTELSAPAPAGFDFGKSGSLRDWLLGGGQIFSPGSYVTPKFGKVAAVPSEPEEHGERRAVFDLELVAQLEEAMEELSVDEERVLREVLEALEAGEEETERLESMDDQAVPMVAVQD